MGASGEGMAPGEASVVKIGRGGFFWLERDAVEGLSGGRSIGGDAERPSSEVSRRIRFAKSDRVGRFSPEAWRERLCLALLSTLDSP